MDLRVVALAESSLRQMMMMMMMMIMIMIIIIIDFNTS